MTLRAMNQSDEGNRYELQERLINLLHASDADGGAMAMANKLQEFRELVGQC